MADEHVLSLSGAKQADAAPLSHERWIVYLSRDRRVLWTDSDSPDSPVPDDIVHAQELVPGASCPAWFLGWHRLLDLAAGTRMPQYGTERLNLKDREGLYTIKVFPDLALDGEFKGLIQIVERARPGVGWDTDIKKTVNAVLDLTLNGVILYRPVQDRVINVNRRVAQQTGYSMASLQDMPGTALFGEPGVEILRALFNRMTIAGDSMIWGQELDIHDNYGETNRFLCSLRIIPERPGSDSPLAMYISLDAASPASGPHPSGPNPRLLISAFRDGLWEYDAATERIYYGRTFTELFGPEGMEGGPGKPMAEVMASVHPDDRQKITGDWRNLVKKGERYRRQYRYRDSSGDWHWILSTIHAILNDANGHPARVVGFHMDITDCIQSDMSLVDAEERLRLVIENAGIGIAVANVDGFLTQANPALARMLGRDQNDLVGRRMSEFADPGDQGRIRGILTRLLRGGRGEKMQEQRFLLPSGERVWVNLTATLSQKAFEGDRYIILMAEDVTERHARQIKLQYEATHDVMTGAWSRWILMERLEQHINLSRRHLQPLAFCLCDLDHFKLVNDTHGHQAGDQVLIRFVELLKQTIRDTEIVGRYGGEEFGIVFPNTPADGATASMERARELLPRFEFAGKAGPFHVSASFGISGATRESTVKSIIEEADAALYQAKERGRDQVVVHAQNPEQPWL